MPSTSSLLKIFFPCTIIFGEGQIVIPNIAEPNSPFLIKKIKRAKCHHCYPWFRQWHNIVALKTWVLSRIQMFLSMWFLFGKLRSYSAWWKKDGIWLPCSFSNASVLPVCAGHCCNVSNTVWCTATLYCLFSV